MCFDAELLGLQHMDESLQDIVKGLICHELNRSDSKYSKCSDLDGYIEELSHKICTSKTSIEVDMALFTNIDLNG